MIRIKSAQDLGSAVVFIVIGAAAVYFGRELAYGTGAKMGPGYFPTILGWLIVAIGVVLAVSSLVFEGPGIERIKFRPLVFVVSTVIGFGFLINLIGLALTAVVLTFAAAFARREVNLIETLILAAGLAVFSVVVFIYGLSQPLPAWWGGE